MGEKGEYFAVDDAFPMLAPDYPYGGPMVMHDVTILEIHDRPETEKEGNQLTRDLIQKYKDLGQDVTIMSGNNLADNEKIADRIDQTKVYVLQV